MTVPYLHELYRSCCGTDPYANGGKAPRVTKDTPLPPMDIIYPSRDTVVDSKLGPPVRPNTSPDDSDSIKRALHRAPALFVLTEPHGRNPHFQSKSCVILSAIGKGH